MQIVALGWHPCLRYWPQSTFQPQDQNQRLPVRSLVTGPGDLWVRTEPNFRDEPLYSNLIELQAYGQAQTRELLIDTSVAQKEPTLYACPNWNEQGFRRLKNFGWKWHKTLRQGPVRKGCHWLVLGLATLQAVAFGTRWEEAEACHLAHHRLRRPPTHMDPALRDAIAMPAAARLFLGRRVATADPGPTTQALLPTLGLSAL